MIPGRARSLILLLLILLCLISRMFFYCPYLEDWDGVDFALALRYYDLSLYQPHFPGYPIFIGLGALIYPFLHDEAAVFISLNIFFSGLTLFPLVRLMELISSRPVAYITALLYLTNPFCWLGAERVWSEPPSLFFILTSFYFFLLSINNNDHKSAFLGGLFLGIASGVRMDYLVFCSVFLYTYPQHKLGPRLSSYGGLGLGLLCWLLPQLCITGGTGYWQEARDFILGHFTRWGGSIYSRPDPLARLKDLFWCLYAQGLAGWWYDTPTYRLIGTFILAFGIAQFLHYWYRGYWHLDPKRRIILGPLIFYTLWIFMAQNLQNPRHILPLLLLSFGPLAEVWYLSQRGPRSPSSILLVSLLVFWTMEGIRLNLLHCSQAPGQLQVIRYVKTHFSEHFTKIYCQEVKRSFDYYAPYYQTKQIDGYAQVKQDLLATYPVMSPILLITSSPAPDLPGLRLKPLKVFQDNRYVHYPGRDLYLYQIQWPEGDMISSLDEKAIDAGETRSYHLKNIGHQPEFPS